ncbi:MAG: tRNA (adenosine(37)-N6)-dimethylallyltransferase MiaA [Planctomycetota bacterium]
MTAHGAGGGDPLDRLPLRFLIGTTASGKSRLALDLAPRLGAEVVALDSMTVYRGLDVGTAKPTPAERALVRHHLLDVADPAERYDVQRYLADVRDALEDIERRGATPLFVGGTGFYLAALLRGIFEGPPIDPELRRGLEARMAREGGAVLHAELAAVDPDAAERIHPNDERRTVRALEVFQQTGSTLTSLQEQWSGERSERERRATIVGLAPPAEILERRIVERTAEMLAAGWPDEALRLSRGDGLGPSAIQALGYDTALALGRGEVEFDEARDLIALRTRQFARRQRTWFRKFDVRWIDPLSPDAASDALATFLAD